MRQIQKAVIPAAGLGTRLLPATKSQCKEMLPVGQKPTIQHVIEEIHAAGIRKILIVTSQQKRAIEDHFDSDPLLLQQLEQSGKSTDGLRHLDLDIELFYTRQKNPRGLADAIGRAEAFAAGEPFIVCLGDAIIHGDEPGSLVKRLTEAYEETEAGAVIAFQRVASEDVVKYGIAAPKDKIGARFEVADLIEKPSVQEAPSNLAITARYAFSPDVFDFIRQTPPGRGNEIQITDSVRLMIRAGHSVWGVRLADNEVRYDVGNFQTYYRAFFEFALMDPEFGESFREYARQRLQP